MPIVTPEAMGHVHHQMHMAHQDAGFDFITRLSKHYPLSIPYQHSPLWKSGRPRALVEENKRMKRE